MVAYSKGMPVGTSAPAFSLPGVDMDGRSYSLDAFQEAKLLVVIFTACSFERGSSIPRVLLAAAMPSCAASRVVAQLRFLSFCRNDSSVMLCSPWLLPAVPANVAGLLYPQSGRRWAGRPRPGCSLPG